MFLNKKLTKLIIIFCFVVKPFFLKADKATEMITILENQDKLRAMQNFLVYQKDLWSQIKNLHSTGLEKFTSVGYEFEFATIPSQENFFADGVTHIELAESVYKVNGLSFYLETDALNQLELVTPPFLLPVDVVNFEKINDLLNQTINAVLRQSFQVQANSGSKGQNKRLDLMKLIKNISKIFQNHEGFFLRDIRISSLLDARSGKDFSLLTPDHIKCNANWKALNIFKQDLIPIGKNKKNLYTKVSVELNTDSELNPQINMAVPLPVILSMIGAYDKGVKRDLAQELQVIEDKKGSPRSSTLIPHHQLRKVLKNIFKSHNLDMYNKHNKFFDLTVDYLSRLFLLKAEDFLARTKRQLYKESLRTSKTIVKGNLNCRAIEVANFSIKDFDDIWVKTWFLNIVDIYRGIVEENGEVEEFDNYLKTLIVSKQVKASLRETLKVVENKLQSIKDLISLRNKRSSINKLFPVQIPPFGRSFLADEHRSDTYIPRNAMIKMSDKLSFNTPSKTLLVVEIRHYPKKNALKMIEIFQKLLNGSNKMHSSGGGSK